MCDFFYRIGLSVREIVAATAPLPEVHAGAAADRKVAVRRRVDGGYTLAPPGATELFVGPDAVRALPKYATQLKHSPFGQMLYPAAPWGFPDAWGTPRRWRATDGPRRLRSRARPGVADRWPKASS